MTPISAVEPRYRRATQPAAGFTLLELLVVLALVLLAIGIVIPNVATTATSSFNAEVRQAVSILKYARRLAIVEGTPKIAHFVALDPQDGDFSQAQQQWQQQRGPADWISSDIGLEYRREMKMRGEKRDAIEIVFFPQGGSTGGVLAFVDDERRAEIRIDSITGRIATAYNGESLDEEALDAAF